MRRARGFTLVELLIVITIFGLLVGLVGGLGVERLQKARAQEEWLVVERTVRGLAFRAFAEGRPVAIDADGARIAWTFDGVAAGRLDLEHWFSPPGQRVLINANGVAVPATLEVRRGADARPIPLNDWFGDGR